MKFGRILKITAISVSSLVGLFALLIVAIMIIISIPSVQNNLVKKACEMLTQELGTDVKVESLSYNVFHGLEVKGVEIDDRAGVKMISVDKTHVRLDLWQLLRKHIEVESVEIISPSLNFYNSETDTVPNFALLGEALSRDANEPDTVGHPQFTFNIENVLITDVFVDWDKHSGPKPKDTQFGIKRLQLKDKRLKIEKLTVQTDNHKPRVNVGKPNHGAFDAGHLDLEADIDLKFNHLAKDSVSLTVNNISGIDKGSDLHADSVTFSLTTDMKRIHIADLNVRSKHTRVCTPTADFVLPSDDHEFEYHSGEISIYTLLQDIAPTFAPVLKKFTTPLRVSVKMSGNKTDIVFSDIYVYTEDKKLEIFAEGGLEHVNIKEKTFVHFDVSKMHAAGPTKDRIISHFPVQQTMMPLVRNVGGITFKGYVKVPYKREIFGGHLSTAIGPVDFKFDMDEITKYMHGHATSKAIKLGKLLDDKKMGDLGVTADFMFDIAGKKKALELHRHHGKLPSGYIKGVVHQVRYGVVGFHDLTFNVESNGDIAEGEVVKPGKLLDVDIAFSFENTEFNKSLKIKPRLKAHKKSEKEKQEKKDKKKDTKKK